jgi:hypothetical protein
MRTGGQGDRYAIEIGGGQRYLFFERSTNLQGPRIGRWFVVLGNPRYYSTSYSYEEYYKSHDQIYRKGQSRPCTYIFLRCAETIDEVMFKAIMDKQTQTELIEESVKHIYGYSDPSRYLS